MRITPVVLILVSVISSTATAQKWQDFRMPNDTTIFHKMCSIENLIWAIDYGNGRVFHSSDDGQNWQLQFETEGEFLEAIQFLDKQTGYLCGDYGLIMKSTDGGESWREIGPSYAPRITKHDEMEGDTSALKRYFYQMYFKDLDHGLVWGFQVNPVLGWQNSQETFFYETRDGGISWDKRTYERPEFDALVESFLEGSTYQDKDAFRIYRTNDSSFRLRRNQVSIQEDKDQNWQDFPLPQLPDQRYILRTLHFLHGNQGYIFGGNLEEPSQGYLLESLDHGRSWRMKDTDLPHIHYSLQTEEKILLSGKNSLLTRWSPELKADSSFVHYGDATKILINGEIKRGEWSGANRTMIKEGIDLYTLQDEHFLYLSIHYDTSSYANYYCDLYFDLGQDTLLNIHASQQLGERVLTGDEWTDSEPPFKWGYISDWTANTIAFDRAAKSYIPYTSLEFQIAKSKLPANYIRLALQTRDINWEEEIVELPMGLNLKSSEDWLLLHF